MSADIEASDDGGFTDQARRQWDREDQRRHERDLAAINYQPTKAESAADAFKTFCRWMGAFGIVYLLAMSDQVKIAIR